MKYKRQNAVEPLKLASGWTDCSESGTVGKLLTRLSPNARFATCEYFDENAFVIKNNNNVKHWQ